MTPPPLNGGPQDLAIGRNCFLTVFGNPTEVRSESSATHLSMILQRSLERGVWREKPFIKKILS